MHSFPALTELRRMTISQLKEVAIALRKFIPENTREKKGHMESSLSVTELTVGLHHVFNTPSDKLIWDVGHQAYAHKILTDRAASFSSNRQKGGLSGFPKISESPFDAFGTGHSSTSISAIVGMAFENRRKGKTNKHVAIIGDGALTGGMAFEALNFLGSTSLDVLIILNDNRKAIDANIGALHDGNNYEMFFQSLGIRWMGHADGTDLADLIPRLREAKEALGPRILHVETRPEILPSKNPDYSASHPFQEVFGQAVLEKLQSDPDLLVISPAMLSGAGLTEAKKAFPERVIDVGIAEQHATTMAAGIAAEGGKVLLHMYSTFAQRAYDQIIHDIALQNLPVTIAIDRAGLVGNDGPTHHGSYDLAFLRPIPNLIIAAPRNGIELRNTVHTGLESNLPFIVRYPRDTEARFDAKGQFSPYPIGYSEWLTKGDILCIIATGTMSRRAIEVADLLEEKGYKVSVLHLLFVKPMDEAALYEATSHTHWVVMEDSSLGGLSSGISEWIAEKGPFNIEITPIRLPDAFIEHGTVEELHSDIGLDASSVYQVCIDLLTK